MAVLPVDNLLVSKLDIVAVIDGTGPISDATYQQDFKNSFCRQIKQRRFAGIYRRGVPGEQDTTSIFGSVYSQARSVAVAFDGESTQNALDMGNLVRQTGSTFDRARASRSPFANVTAGFSNPYGLNPLQQQIEIVDGLSNSTGIKDYRIFLVGYSRGGSECIFLANLLQRAGLAVEAMFLFDAVNMTIDLAPFRKIPSNVKVCYHAHRNPNFANAYWSAVQVATRKLQPLTQQAWALSFSRPVPFPSRPIPTALQPQADAARSELAIAEDKLDKTRSNRWTKHGVFDWGNVGVEAADENETKLEKLAFDCSHGAMGGVPWPATMFPRDLAVSIKVHDWMWKRLEAHNVFPEARVVNPNMRFIA